MTPPRRGHWLLLGVWLALGLAFPALADAPSPPGAAPAKPVPVQVAAVTTATVTETASFIGSLVPWQRVNIASATLNNITAIYVTQGQKVAKGDPLFLLDDRTAKADVQSAKAQLQDAQLQFTRAQELIRSNAVSQADMDKATSTYVTAQANLNSAKTKLDLLTLRAPFAGVAGIVKNSVGTFAIMGETQVTLEDNTQLYVDFHVPQQLLLQVRIGQTFTFTADALGEKQHSGTIQFIDPSITEKTRSIEVRGLVPNPDRKLIGDLAVRVNLQMAVHENAVVAPTAALIPTLAGNDIYRVVNRQAQRVQVKVGVVRDGRAEILQGLQAGDQVVTVGQLDLEDGMAVSVTNGPG